jgi:DNA-binding LytR/AlgR family response regulator
MHHEHDAEANPTFIAYQGDKLIPMPSDEIACFCIVQGVVIAITATAQRVIDESLDAISARLSRAAFFRVSRHCIVQRRFIVGAQVYAGGRLLVHLSLTTPVEILVSREKVPQFKAWLQGIG